MNGALYGVVPPDRLLSLLFIEGNMFVVVKSLGIDYSDRLWQGQLSGLVSPNKEKPPLVVWYGLLLMGV